MTSRVLHFALLGALLFAAQAVWSPAPLPAARPTIVVPASSDAAATDAAIDDELLFREALARQFDGSDKVVRARLVRVGRFLGLGQQGGSDAAVEREARALGLQRSDPVIRRHLVEMMRLAAAKPGRQDLPSESTLIAYYREHAERFAQPARIHLTHVYLSAERRGADLEREATELLVALRRDNVTPAAAARLGDPFVRGAELTLTAPVQIEAVFGAEFAAAVGDLPERTWSAPLRSPYGLHVVWVEERIAAAPPPFAAVRSRVLHALLNERGEARLRAALQALRARYDVRIGAPM
jgi:parvulin-like peptidyl-prolyl isomerase